MHTMALHTMISILAKCYWRKGLKMSSNAEELEKLAELKERGVLTEAEFAKQKKSLLSAGKKPWTAWRIIKTVVLGWILVCILAVGWGSLVGEASAASTCDKADVKQKVVEIVNGQISGFVEFFGPAGGLPRVLGLESATELFGAPKSGYFACMAETKTETGKGAIGYTVEWGDKANGLMVVRLADLNILLSKYRPKKNEGPAPLASAPLADTHSSSTSVDTQVERAAEQALREVPDLAGIHVPQAPAVASEQSETEATY